jgi:transcriptional regulator
MYLPKIHEETNTQTLHGLIKSYPLGCIVTLGRDGLTANHIPFLIDPTAGEHGTLRGHVARANPMRQDFSGNTEAMVILLVPDQTSNRQSRADLELCCRTCPWISESP